METYLLSVLSALCCIGLAFGVTTWDSGDGIVYKLSVTQDVALENPSSNHNGLQYLLVGLHPQFPNKRSLLQFENPPTACSGNRIRWAKMYVYYAYAHKASWHSVQQTPFISRPIQVYQVKKSWNEAQATSTKRDNSNNWSQQYLGLTGNDAGPAVIDTVTVFTSRPKGFVEFDVTDAVKSWRNNGCNYGVLLRASNEYTPGRGIRFYSKSHSDATKHAYINVMCQEGPAVGNPGGPIDVDVGPIELPYPVRPGRPLPDFDDGNPRRRQPVDGHP